MVRECVGKLEGTCDRGTFDGLLLFLGCVLQLLAVGIDRRVTSGCRLGVSWVPIRRALILFGGLAEILVLEEKVRETVVDGR
jgi:hypothetical protein